MTEETAGLATGGGRLTEVVELGLDALQLGEKGVELRVRKLDANLFIVAALFSPHTLWRRSSRRSDGEFEERRGFLQTRERRLSHDQVEVIVHVDEGRRPKRALLQPRH